MDQNEFASKNRAAWDSDSYAAWIRQYGIPSEAAKILRADPADKLRRVIHYLPELKNLNIANPLGSHGRIATALALLGAHVTVFDISESNARYASELFTAAGVEVEYVLGDFQSTAHTCAQAFDAVVMELGVIHYFHDITQFVAAVRCLIPVDRSVVLNEFHPIVKKSISIGSGGISLMGDYFSSDPETAQTPYEDYVNTDIPTCLIRRWNLGEIVTAFASGGFHIQRLIEHPSSELAHLPDTFTLVARSA